MRVNPNGGVFISKKASLSKVSTTLQNANYISDFEEVISIIERAKTNAFGAANQELINMYWDIGRYVSEKVKSDGWGNSVVKDFSQFIQSRFLGIRGFSPQNIWRMKQFYENYRDNEKLSTLSREISWTNNVHTQRWSRDAR